MPSAAPSLSLLLLALTLSRSHPQQPAPPAATPPTADAIMARVAANQDRANLDRLHYVYLQHARVLSRKGKTVMCEEITDSRISPSETTSHTDLLQLNGRLLEGHTYVTYTTLAPNTGDVPASVDTHDHSLSIVAGSAMDRDLVENMRSNLTRDNSKDGLAARLFPLTSANQASYAFHLVGREHLNNRDVFHVDFVPKDKDDFGWKGSAFIDTTAFEPVVVRTVMARKIPFAVRTLLGTSLPGLGFTVVYAPQPDGVWFPSTFGTEFKLHVLFFLHRDIIIDARNSSFEKTHVHSEIVSIAPAPTSPPSH